MMHSDEYNLIKEAFDSIEKKMPYKPDIALVLGSGMGSFIDHFNVDMKIPYSEVKNIPVSTVDGHNGQFVFFKSNEKNVVCMQGRVHLYEGYNVHEVVRPTRLLSMMGVKLIILTNAAGAIDTKMKPGDLMMITDQINLFVKSPLVGTNIDEFGIRFPNMHDLYDINIQDIIRNTAKEKNIDLKEGVYCQLQGPHFETKSDIKALSLLGASSVAMSTGVEAIAAHHAGMKVAGFSYISNMATGLGESVTHEELLKNSAKTVEKLIRLFEGFITKI